MMMPSVAPETLRQLEQVLEICRNLSANLELDPLLTSIIEGASALTSSESSAIMVFDKESRTLRFVAAPFYVAVTVSSTVPNGLNSVTEPPTPPEPQSSRERTRIALRPLRTGATKALLVTTTGGGQVKNAPSARGVSSNP